MPNPETVESVEEVLAVMRVASPQLAGFANRIAAAHARERVAAADVLQGERIALRQTEARAEAAEVELRRILKIAPGGHSCDEFHHDKADRHLPDEPCPPMERWRAAIAAAIREQEEVR